MNSSAIASHPFPSAAPARPAPRRPRGAGAGGGVATRERTGAAPIEAVLPTRPGGGNHALGFGTVVLVHLLVGYALVSGLARKVVDSVRAPIEARLIQEEIKEPPPPPKPVEKVKPVVVKVAAPPPPFVPPPEVQVAEPPPAPTIAAVTPVPPPAPVDFKPEPAPVVAPPAPAAPPTVAIGVACPSMVNPVMPRRAQQEGIGGAVKARATIRDGKVVDVQILSSTPRGLFDAAVKSAMSQYGCDTTGTSEIVAVQNFEFRAAQ